jgi:hypothetical protein
MKESSKNSDVTTAQTRPDLLDDDDDDDDDDGDNDYDDNNEDEEGDQLEWM